MDAVSSGLGRRVTIWFVIAPNSRACIWDRTNLGTNAVSSVLKGINVLEQHAENSHFLNWPLQMQCGTMYWQHDCPLVSDSM